MDSDPSDKILKELQSKGVLNASGFVVPCRFEYSRDVFLGLDDNTLSISALRPDGSLSVQQFGGSSVLKITRPTIQTDSFSFVAVVGESLWHFDNIAEHSSSRVRQGLERLLGRKLEEGILSSEAETLETSAFKKIEEEKPEMEPRDDPSSSSESSIPARPESSQSENRFQTADSGNTDVPPADEQALKPEREDAESDADDEEDEDDPWYATVQGPAIDMYFHTKEDSSEVSSGKTGPCSGKADETRKTVHTDSPGRPREVGSLKRLIVKWRKELELNPESIKPYRELCRIYIQSGDTERAYWHSAVLTHFGVAEPVERDFYEKHRPNRPKYVPPCIDQSVWMEAATPLETDQWTRNLFALLARPLTIRMGKTLRSYGLKMKDRCDVGNEKLLVAKIFSNLREAMGFVALDLFLNPDADFGLLVANVVEKKRWSPLFVAGSRILTGRNEEEITFLLARDMAFLRPEHITFLLLPKLSQQTFLMTAAMKLVKPNLVDPSPNPERDDLVKMLAAELTQREFSGLESLVEQMVVEKINVDLSRWAQQTMAACNRAGLLYCQDLAAAVKVSSMAPLVPSTPEETASLMRDLVLFSISPQHFQARKKLKIQIE